MKKSTVDENDRTLIERGTTLVYLAAIVVPGALVIAAALVMLAYADYLMEYIAFTPSPLALLAGMSCVPIFLAHERLLRCHPNPTIRAAARRDETAKTPQGSNHYGLL